MFPEFEVCNTTRSTIGSTMPEVRGTAEPHGGAYPPCSTLPRTYSRLSSLQRCGLTG